MRRLVLAASLVLAVAVPGSAQAFTKADATRYERAYAHARHVFGAEAVGCRLFATCRGRVTDARLARSTGVLHRMFAPPPRPAPASASVVRAAVSSTVATVTSSVQSVASSSGVPACASESGTNYSTGAANTNPSSGATGRYQQLPSHFASGGDCAGLSISSPSGQDQCAAILYQRYGASQWVGCGG